MSCSLNDKERYHQNHILISGQALGVNVNGEVASSPVR